MDYPLSKSIGEVSEYFANLNFSPVSNSREGSASHSNLCSQVLKNPALKGWERLFVSTLAVSPNPGRRQLEKLEAISARLNQVGGEASRLTSELKALPKGGTANG